MTTFQRTATTWLCYGMIGVYAYLQAGVGPLMPFLRDELGLNFTAAALHLSAFALGMTAAGLTSDLLARRFGRRAVFWGGGGGMMLGVVLLALGARVEVTIAGAFLMGYPGSLLLSTLNAVLADTHAAHSASALTEANIAASLFAIQSSLYIGGLETLGIGWRGALVLVMGVWVLAFVLFRGITLPDAPPRRAQGAPARLPRLFWGYWGILVLGVAAEWCVAFWAADFLRVVAGYTPETAAALTAVFSLAMITGRIVGSRLVRRVPARRLLLSAYAVTLVGLPVYWLLPLPALNVAGLFVVGLGIANTFPLTLAVVTSTVPDQTDAATARVSLGAGIAMLVMPQVLGTLADTLTLRTAFGVVPVLVLGTFAALLVLQRLEARRRAA